MIPVAGTHYEIKLEQGGYYVVRPSIGGTSANGFFTVAGPYYSRAAAEAEALRRARARRAA